MAYDVWQSCMLFPVDFKRSDCASWVQAWGSILAICAAITIAWAQRVADRRRAAEATRQIALKQMAVVTALADHACNRIDLLPDTTFSFDDAEGFFEYLDTRMFVDTAEALRRIGPSDVPSGNVMIQILGLVRCLEDAASYGKHFSIRNWSDGAEGVEDTKAQAQTNRNMLLHIQRNI